MSNYSSHLAELDDFVDRVLAIKSKRSTKPREIHRKNTNKDVYSRSLEIEKE